MGKQFLTSHAQQSTGERNSPWGALSAAWLLFLSVWVSFLMLHWLFPSLLLPHLLLLRTKITPGFSPNPFSGLKSFLWGMPTLFCRNSEFHTCAFHASSFHDCLPAVSPRCSQVCFSQSLLWNKGMEPGRLNLKVIHFAGNERTVWIPVWKY